MKPTLPPATAAPATLKTVLDCLTADPSLSDSRKRDLRSAILTYARLKGQPAAAIALDLAEIRKTLDGMVAAQAGVSRKRWSNLRSDLGSAIAASGLRPMVRTANVKLDESWARFLAPAERSIRHALSRLVRWASLREIAPEVIDDRVIDRFIAELDTATLTRKLPELPRSVALAWNALVGLHQGDGLRPVSVPPSRFVSTRIPWDQLPVSFREDVEQYRVWASRPDPLGDDAREKALAPLSLRLQQTHIHSAASAAVAAGIPIDQITSLASLVDPEMFRRLMGHMLRQDRTKQCLDSATTQDGGASNVRYTLSAYTHGVAVTLIDIASHWTKASEEVIAKLKALRSKLGSLPDGLTPKNDELMRRFEDARLVDALLALPDKLWRLARRGLATSKRPFIDLQTALAIDILVHVPLRLQNLKSLRFGTHLHWPQGRRKPALLTFKGEEIKNRLPLNYELPAELAERLQVYRNEIAPAVIGQRPDEVFVAITGRQKTQAALAVAIEKTLLRYLGVKMTCHQFRHLAAKLILDANPAAYELVRQVLGHKNIKTTTKFYAGTDTKRAGRAHAELLMKLRESKLSRGRARTPRPRGPRTPRPGKK